MDKDKNTDKTRSSAMHSKPIHANTMNGRIDDEEWIKEVRRTMVGREVKAPTICSLPCGKRLLTLHKSIPRHHRHRPIHHRKSRFHRSRLA